MAPKPLGSVRRPPMQAKLEQLLDQANSYAADDYAAMFKATDGVRKLYHRGLAKGLTPEIVTAAIARVEPYGFELKRLTKLVGADYDAAVLAGLAQCRAAHGAQFGCDLILTASLSTRRGLSVAHAWERVSAVERLVDLSPNGNVPSDVSPAKLDAIGEAMAVWFAPDLVGDTLALANERMPPTPGAEGERRWVNPPQSASNWAWLIGCALHPSDAAHAALRPRAACVLGLDEPVRSIARAIFAHARDLYGERVPALD